LGHIPAALLGLCPCGVSIWTDGFATATAASNVGSGTVGRTDKKPSSF